MPNKKEIDTENHKRLKEMDEYLRYTQVEIMKVLQEIKACCKAGCKPKSKSKKETK